MRNYIAVAVGAVFLSVVISFIIPDGKLNKTITFILRSATILILITPVTQLFNISIASSDGDIIDYEWICATYSKSQSEILKNAIYEKFETDCDCYIEFVYSDGQFSENGVTVTLNSTDEKTKNAIYEYLQELGYIYINVNETAD
jgi:hypothetical protein